MRLLLAAPYPAFVLQPSTALAALLVVTASLGHGSGLALQERLVDLTPHAVRSRVQGVESAGRMALQGPSVLLTGGLAEIRPPHVAMAVVAVLSLAVTLATMRGVRRPMAASEAADRG
ncbi:hypothetical protein GCM10027418_28160 [Mariniluteicoccus endophyticus]